MSGAAGEGVFKLSHRGRTACLVYTFMSCSILRIPFFIHSRKKKIQFYTLDIYRERDKVRCIEMFAGYSDKHVIQAQRH